jgi:hypothetical protein
MKTCLQTVPTVLMDRPRPVRRPVAKAAPAARAPAERRAATTMRALLVWAYKRELVRASEGIGRDRTGPPGGSNTSAVCRVLRSGIVGSGPVARITHMPVHPDAERVHALVKRLDRDEFWLVVGCAEADAAPEWAPQFKPFRVVPVLRANGKPKMITCPRDGRPVACRIEIEGVSKDEIQRRTALARDRYSEWLRCLWMLREKMVEDDTLTRWHVTGLGAEAEPWHKITAAGG